MAAIYSNLLIVVISLIFSNLHSTHGTTPESKFYSYSAKDIRTGEEVEFSKYKGKVVLIVNVASNCGYTVENYEQLVQLQKQYKPEKFAVLGFPCNQFGAQEPRKNNGIFRFADERFQVNFDLFQKIEVVGEDAHPLYQWLKKRTKTEEPTWNFTKYLLDRKGNVVRFASAWVEPKKFREDIEQLIAGQKLKGGLLEHDDVVQEILRDEL